MGIEILVVGAGPVGLAGALFTKREGRQVRIVEKLLEPVQQSRALAVNPRTLEILEASGVTEKMLERGRKIHQACLWDEKGAALAEIELRHLHSRYPFMLALSQSVTERLLEDALAKKGVQVERGREVIACENVGHHARTKFRDGVSLHSDYVFAADGAHSIVREKAKIPFKGSSMKGDWFLADVALDTRLAPDCAHVFFLEEGGFRFLVPVVEDDRRPQAGDPIWRVISSTANPLEKIPFSTATAEPMWRSNFHIAHRICAHMQEGAIFLAGDAAHIHSPAGARGMNLGIEDACVFAKLLSHAGLRHYDEQRRAVDKKVVHRVDLISRIAAGDQTYLRMLRKFVLPEALKMAPLQAAFTRAMSGLDHPLVQ